MPQAAIILTTSTTRCSNIRLVGRCHNAASGNHSYDPNTLLHWSNQKVSQCRKRQSFLRLTEYRFTIPKGTFVTMPQAAIILTTAGAQNPCPERVSGPLFKYQKSVYQLCVNN